MAVDDQQRPHIGRAGRHRGGTTCPLARIRSVCIA
jgi:hypothetical protein